MIVDAPTVSSLGFSVPITSGDDNYNATAQVSYRRSGTANWLPALDMMRVRPETIGLEDPPENFGLPRPGEQFAGSVLSLEANTDYEVRIEVSDPDGGSRTQTVTVRTRPVPRADPLAPRVVNVASAAELQAALQNAVAGDVIIIATGTYAGRFDILNRHGTEENPIVIRGEDRIDTVIDGTGQGFAVYVNGSDYVHVENLRITGVTGEFKYGMYLGNGEGLTARNLVFETDNGIYANSESGGPNRGFYICDNELTGSTIWPTDLAVGSNTAQKGWIGIGIAGHGHTVCHNTLSGYGSTIYIGFDSIAHSIAIDIHNNDIQWTMDDGIELDGAFRNVRAWENRITNSLMGISFQPVWGGPVYAYRNIVYNSAAAPFKLNNDPTGIVLYHNTVFRYAETDIFGPYDANAWPQLGLSGSYAANAWIRNNIFIGNAGALYIRQSMPYLQLDYNGYLPDQPFWYGEIDAFQFYQDLAAFQAGTGFESHGITMSGAVFSVSPPAAADYTIFAPLLDFALQAGADAIDGGVPLPTVNDGFAGSAPDLGALEAGDMRVYGIRAGGALPPVVPAPVALFPAGGETLDAATTVNVSWDGNGAPPQATFDIAYRDNCTADIVFSDDMESGAGPWSVSHATGSSDWVLSATNPHSGASAWSAGEPNTVTDQYLSTAGTIPVPVNGELVFWHNYSTEPGYDGGVVEVSTDGVVWNDLGPDIIQGAYNSTINTCCSSPISGRNAFSGNSGGYLETVVDLGGYAGLAVYLRFRMTTDIGTSGSGWSIDDVSVRSAASPWWPVATSQPGATTVLWMVPLTTGADYCLAIQGKAPGYTDSPQVVTGVFAIADADTDGDGLNNIHEVTVAGTDPENVDSDGDGLADGAGAVVPVALLPGGIDVDGDGFIDGELDFGTDPAVSNTGDVGPRGSPDNRVDFRDFIVMRRLVSGVITADPIESILGDINMDGLLSAGDLPVLQQKLLSGTDP